DLIRKNIPESYIILMNQDDKKFANYTPDDKIADDYLDKNYLFEEIIKISNSFDQVLNNELINEYS
ncbi:MAG: hypothetical protein Q8M94_10170, partial [Ignavibacteria bacterium]|nr:hypothetical protein [Ignavibacteria bacterium]